MLRRGRHAVPWLWLGQAPRAGLVIPSYGKVENILDDWRQKLDPGVAFYVIPIA